MVIILQHTNKFVHEYGKHIMEKFEFENGETLENVEVEYLIKGTPKFDDCENITNLVVFCHGYEGNCLSLNELHSFTSDGMPLDFNKYLILSIASLGFPNSCCPSSTGLGNNFPEYNFKDKVNFKKQFIKEKLGNDNVLGVLGVGMGGYEVYTWACEYPDDMKFNIVGGSSYKTAGYRYVMIKGIKNIIENNANFNSECYDESFSNTMISVYQVIFSMYFSQKIFQEMSNDEIDVFMDQFVEKSYSIDIHDFKFQYDVLLDYNIEDKLANIKSDVLVFIPENNLYFSSKDDIENLNSLIKNCQTEVLDFKRNKFNEMDFNHVMSILYAFLKKFE